MRENFAFVTAHENVVLLPAALLISNTPDLNLKKRNERKEVSSSSSNPGKEKLQKINEQTDTRTNGQTDKRTNGQTDKQTDKQTNTKLNLADPTLREKKCSKVSIRRTFWPEKGEKEFKRCL